MAVSYFKASCSALTLSLMLGTSLAPAATAQQPSHESTDVMPVKDIKAFADAFEQIKQDYVEDVSNETLLTGAIRGMLERLDPHSDYLDASQLKQLRQQTDGEFSGIGIQLGYEDGRLVIVSTLDHSPAQKAGLKPHDTLRLINGTSTAGLNLDKVSELLRGEAGSRVTLGIQHPGSHAISNLTLTRTTLHSDSVSSQLLDNGIGYLKISDFQTTTGEEVERALAQFKRNRLKGLVLDLRDNPGGVLDAAVQVTSQFVEHGLVVYTKGRDSASNQQMNVTGHTSVANTVPMVVVINGNSASAAEIVAGALKDHHRAVIVGTNSFGKASVQTVFPLDNGGALKLTTARYFTPSGHSIQLNGIQPDVQVAPARVIPDKTQHGIREVDLARHLANTDGADTITPTTGESDETALTADDYQLEQAMNLLKGMMFMSATAPAHASSNG